MFDVKDNWKFTVLRPAKVNHPTPGNRYAGWPVTVLPSVVTPGHVLSLKSLSLSPRTLRTPPRTAGGTQRDCLILRRRLQADWAAGSTIVPIMFAQGNDSLFFTDGTGAIYAWTGGVPTSSTVGGGTLMKIGSHSILDDFDGYDFHSCQHRSATERTDHLLWFQNRLIASGIAA